MISSKFLSHTCSNTSSSNTCGIIGTPSATVALASLDTFLNSKKGATTVANSCI